jgi:hypothetical protein
MANIKFPTQEGSNQNKRFLNGKRQYSPIKPSAKFNERRQLPLKQAPNSTKEANSP